MRFIRILTHPLSFPVYTYALFLEMERQSYVLQTSQLITILLLALLMIISRMMISNGNHSEPSPYTAPDVPTRRRILAASTVTLIFTTLAIIAKSHLAFYTWGAHTVFSIYILPAWIILLNGKSLLAAAYSGAMAGFCIIIGYKTSTDTFWPFVISLFLFTISSYINTTRYNEHFFIQFAAHVAGILQAVMIMFIFA